MPHGWRVIRSGPLADVGFPARHGPQLLKALDQSIEAVLIARAGGRAGVAEAAEFLDHLADIGRVEEHWENAIVTPQAELRAAKIFEGDEIRFREFILKSRVRVVLPVSRILVSIAEDFRRDAEQPRDD